jgi:2'-5' RNA ligase
MRLFVGIPLPEEVAARVRDRIDALRPLADLKWSHARDLHVTTKFIGEQPPSRVPDIERALGALTPRAHFPIAVREVGWFPAARAARVFWAGVAAPESLTTLAADTEAALEPLGVTREERAYAPHITLARVPRGARLDPLRQALAASPAPDFGTFTVDGFTLYESTSPAAGDSTRYRALARFSFTGEA